jgi:hypothetical protein
MTRTSETPQRRAPVTVDEIIARAGGVKEKSGEWSMVTCPAHDDSKASLAVKQGEVRPILYCHAQCAEPAIWEAFGLEAPGPAAVARLARSPVLRDGATPGEIAAWIEARHQELTANATAMARLASWGWHRELVEAERLGLAKLRGRDWLVIPDRQGGKIVAATLRVLDSTRPCTRHKRPECKECKWLRLPKGVAGAAIWGADELEDCGTAIVFEGLRDAITGRGLSLGAEAGAAAGAAIVAIPGVGRASRAADLLKGQRLIIIGMDSDPAGEEGAQKLADAVGHEKCRRLTFDGAKDLCNLVERHGEEAQRLAVEAMRKALETPWPDALTIPRPGTLGSAPPDLYSIVPDCLIDQFEGVAISGDHWRVLLHLLRGMVRWERSFVPLLCNGRRYRVRGIPASTCLEPGDSLVGERGLAEACAVSRDVVRGALAGWQRRGVVELIRDPALFDENGAPLPPPRQSRRRPPHRPTIVRLRFRRDLMVPAERTPHVGIGQAARRSPQFKTERRSFTEKVKEESDHG